MWKKGEYISGLEEQEGKKAMQLCLFFLLLIIFWLQSAQCGNVNTLD